MTFHRQNISYLHSAWMYSGLEHRDNRGRRAVAPVRFGSCDGRTWSGVGGNGEMALLNEATWEKVRLLFPSDQHNGVARILETECGNNLGATLAG